MSVCAIVQQFERQDSTTLSTSASKPTVLSASHSVPVLADNFERGAKERILARRVLKTPSKSPRCDIQDSSITSSLIAACSLYGQAKSCVPLKWSVREFDINAVFKPKKTFKEWGIELLVIVDATRSSSPLRPYQKMARYLSARNETTAIAAKRRAFASAVRPSPLHPRR